MRPQKGYVVWMAHLKHNNRNSELYGRIGIKVYAFADFNGLIKHNQEQCQKANDLARSLSQRFYDANYYMTEYDHKPKD